MKLKLKMKVFMVLGILLLVLLVTNSYLIISNNNISRQNKDIRDKIYQSYKTTIAWSYELDGLVAELNAASDLGSTETLKNALTKADKINSDIIKKLKETNLEDAAALNVLESHFITYINLSKEIVEILANKGDAGKIVNLSLDKENALKKLKTGLNEYKELKSKRLYERIDAINRLLSRSNIINIVIVILFILVMAFIAFWANISLIRPINSVVSNMNQSANQVAATAGQLSSASQSLAEGSSEQAASIEESSSSLEEMSSMTKQNADNANQADSLMKQVNQIIGKANNSMTNLTVSMEEIKKASEQTFKIIKTIDEIAFQTNLLALNAAVEAARAGEYGQGFAVVADEVRSLAMRAADAAKNTSALIEGTVKKVNDGSDLVNKANEAFGEVSTSANKVGGLVAEIAAASSEQAKGIEQVNLSVLEMDKVVQSNAASAEQSASASQEMKAQAQTMKGIIVELVSLVEGKGVEATEEERAIAI